MAKKKRYNWLAYRKTITPEDIADFGNNNTQDTGPSSHFPGQDILQGNQDRGGMADPVIDFEEMLEDGTYRRIHRSSGGKSEFTFSATPTMPTVNPQNMALIETRLNNATPHPILDANNAPGQTQVPSGNQVDPFEDVRRLLPAGITLTPTNDGMVEFADPTGSVLPIFLKSIGQGLGTGQQVWQEGRGPGSSFMQQSIISQIDKQDNINLSFRSSADQLMAYVTRGRDIYKKGEASSWLAGFKHVKSEGESGLEVVPAIPVPTGMYESADIEQGLGIRMIYQTPDSGPGAEMAAIRKTADYLKNQLATNAGYIGTPTIQQNGETKDNPNYIPWGALRRGGYAPGPSGKVLTVKNYYSQGYNAETGQFEAYMSSGLTKNRRSMEIGGLQPEYVRTQGKGKYKEVIPIEPGAAGSNSYYQLLGTVPEGFTQAPAGMKANWVFMAGLNAGGIETWRQKKSVDKPISGFTTRESTDLTVEDLNQLAQPGVFELGATKRLIKAYSNNTTVGTYNKPGTDEKIPINIDSPITNTYLTGGTLVLPLRTNEAGTEPVFGEKHGISAQPLLERILKANPGLHGRLDNVTGPKWESTLFQTENTRIRYQVKGEEEYNPVGFQIGGTEFQYGTDELKTSTFFGSSIWGSRSIKQRQGMLKDWSELVGTEAAKNLSSLYNAKISQQEGNVNTWDLLASSYRELTKGTDKEFQGEGTELSASVWNTLFENVDPKIQKSMDRNRKNRKEYQIGWVENNKGKLDASYPKVFSPEALEFHQAMVDENIRALNPEMTDEEVIKRRNSIIEVKGKLGTNIRASIHVPRMMAIENLVMPEQMDYNARVRLNLQAMTSLGEEFPEVAQALGLNNPKQEITSMSERAQYGFSSWRMYQKGLDEGGSELPRNAIPMDVNKTTDLSAYLWEHRNAKNTKDEERQGSDAWYAGVISRTGDPTAMLHMEGTNTLMPGIASAISGEVPSKMGEQVGQSVNKWVETFHKIANAEYFAPSASSKDAKEMGREAISDLYDYQSRVQEARSDASKELTRKDAGMGIAGKYVSTDLMPLHAYHIFEDQAIEIMRRENPNLNDKELKAMLPDFYKQADEGIYFRHPQLSNKSAIAVQGWTPEQVKAGLGNTPEEQEENYRQLRKSVGNRLLIGKGPSVLSKGDDDGDPFELILNATLSAVNKVQKLIDPNFQSKILNTSKAVLNRLVESSTNKAAANRENAYYKSATNLVNSDYSPTENMSPKKTGRVNIGDVIETRNTIMLNKTGNMPMSFNFGLELNSAGAALGLSKERTSKISDIGQKLYQPAVDISGVGREAGGSDLAMVVGWANAGNSKFGDYLSFGTNQKASEKYTEKHFFNLDNGAGLGTGGEVDWFKQVAYAMTRKTEVGGEKVNLLNAQDYGQLFGSTDARAAEITAKLEATDSSNWGQVLSSFFDIKKTGKNTNNLDEVIKNIRGTVMDTTLMDVMYRKSRQVLPENATNEQIERRANQRRIMDRVVEETGMDFVKGGSLLSSMDRRNIVGQDIRTPGEFRESINSLPDSTKKRQAESIAYRLNIPLDTPAPSAPLPIGANGEKPTFQSLVPINGRTPLSISDKGVFTFEETDQDRYEAKNYWLIKAKAAAEEVRPSSVGKSAWYNPLKNVLRRMSAPVEPEDTKFADLGDAVHPFIEEGLKKRLGERGFGVDTEIGVSGTTPGGRDYSGTIDTLGIKEDPDKPGYLMGEIYDVSTPGGVKEKIAQLSMYRRGLFQEGERVGKPFSKIDMYTQEYIGGGVNLSRDPKDIASDSLKKASVQVQPLSDKELDEQYNKVLNDQRAAVPNAVALTERATKGGRQVTQEEIEKTQSTGSPPSSTPDLTNSQSKIKGKSTGTNANTGGNTGGTDRGGGTGGGGSNRGGSSWTPPTHGEVDTALQTMGGLLAKITPFQESAIEAVYAQVQNMPAMQGQEALQLPADRLTPETMSPSALSHYATNVLGIKLQGSSELAQIKQAWQSVKAAKPYIKEAGTYLDPVSQELVRQYQQAQSSDPGSVGFSLHQGTALASITGSTASGGGVGGKTQGAMTVEEIDKLSTTLKKLEDNATAAKTATGKHAEALGEEKKALMDNLASLNRQVEMRTLETDIKKGAEGRQPGVEYDAKGENAKLRRLQTLEKDELAMQAETVPGGKGVNLGALARRLTSGWGLMYMQNVLGAVAGGGDYGSQEAQAQFASTAGLATTILGEPTIGATMAQRITAAKAKVGGISPRDTAGLYLAEHPGAESVLETAKAGAFAAAGTEWALGMLPKNIITPQTALKYAAGVGLAASAINFGMQVAGETPTSVGNWRYENQFQGNGTKSFAENINMLKAAWANPAAAWAYATGDEKFAKESTAIANLNISTEKILSGGRSVEDSRKILAARGEPASEQQRISAMGTQLAHEYKTDLESANKVAALITLSGGYVDETQLERLLAQASAGIDQSSGITATLMSRGGTKGQSLGATMQVADRMTRMAQTPLTQYERASVSAGEAFVQSQPSFWQPKVPTTTDEYNKFTQGYDLAPMRGDYLSSLIQGAGAMMNLGANVRMPTNKDIPQNVSQWDLMQQQYKAATEQQFSQGILGGDSRMWGLIAGTPGINLSTMPAMQTTFGTQIGAEYAAFTGYNMAGQQTGGQWGRQSLQMGGVNAQTMAQRIYAPVGAAGNVMSNFSQYGQYGQAYIKAQIGNQQDGGVTLDNGQAVGGAIAGQQYIMKQQYSFAQEGIAISKEQNALSGASLAISYKQLAMTQAFQTGVGLGAYTGTINPQTGQPFGISTGNYSFNAPGGYNYSSQGGGQWGIEDAQRNLGYAQTQFGFQMQQKQINLQSSQFGENMALQAQGMALNKAQGLYQYQYGTQMAERQFGFGQTVFEEEKRFMTGRQRRVAERQNDFNVETYNLETDNREKQFDFQKQQWKLQEEQFQLQIKQFHETKQSQQEQLDASRKFFEIGKQLQEEATKLTRASWVNQIQLQKESLAVQAAQIALNARSIELQEKQMDFQRQINGLDLIKQTYEENTIDAINHLVIDTFPKLLGYIKDKIPTAFVEMINNILTSLGAEPVPVPETDSDTGDSGGGGSCFIAGTMVTMLDGSHMPIEDVVPGDMVLSYNTTTKEVVGAMITEIFHHVPKDSDGYILINGNIGVTREHEMYISGKWEFADNIVIGDYLTDRNGNKIIAESIEWFPGGVPTFNLHTDDETHNYFANGVLVHNTTKKMARGGDVLPGNSAILGDSIYGSPTGFEELAYARPGGGISVTPVHGFNALVSNNNGPSPENNTIIKRAGVSQNHNVNNVRVFIGNREITDFIVETVEGELKNG